MAETSSAFVVFRKCCQAIQEAKLISRISETDKEFHFQSWVEARLGETGLRYERGGRNSYPDFRLVHQAEGYEVKGLAYPGRWTSFDSNSQAPSGLHNGRSIYYIFGRYPKRPDGSTYPVLDLVICHGSFLNADNEYVHQNKSVRGFGSYGDILIRDRKMYVVPTPFALVEGVAHTQTLILPEQMEAPPELTLVDKLVRRQAANLIAGYSFDLRTNDLQPATIPNPFAGQEHNFNAWRLVTYSKGTAAMRRIEELAVEYGTDGEND